ncbi:formate dehydrogenase accessory sulfurtransferase FdhD [Pararhodobacter oceanensis]|uniref:formate dehydrogenase accessory sulfurtransferase FdhD n=1 Tax=Pararhodobacter oceanensis TaxID=2172121 RepID=UPI003A8EB97A
MRGARPKPRLRFGAGIEPGERVLPEETGVALSFNGTTQAVMMATPDHLEDFAYGFALTEGLVAASEIDSVSVIEAGPGLDVQVWVSEDADTRLKERRRSMLGPVGCGLCGIDSLEQVFRDLPAVTPNGFSMTPAQIIAAITALRGEQRLHDATRAVHCAAWWSAGALRLAREDVGRHNALDKLVGAMVRASTHPTAAALSSRYDPAQGAVVMTSRLSIDLVQKVASLGAPVIIAVSSPTADAVELADRLGITLIAQARPDGFEVFTHTDRIATETEYAR